MTAKALRTLLRVIGARNSARVNLKINEPEGSTRPKRDAMASDAPIQKLEASEDPTKALDDMMNELKA
jgi:hypothetical protein